jgi:tRNA dimethylallyltransferase
MTRTSQHSQSRAPFLALVGPTASGKTEAAVELAERLSAEIVSVDSMVLYRGMDIGTAKPTAEERRRVRHHLLDVAEPGEPLSVAWYQELATAAVRSIRQRGAVPLLVGGSGLYFRAIVDGLSFPGTDPLLRRTLEAEAGAAGPRALHRRLEGLDPAAARKIEPGNARRTVRALEVAALTGRPFSTFAAAWERYPRERVRAAGIALPPDVLRTRIERRVHGMLEGGFLDEVRELVANGFEASLTSSQAIGYAEMARHLAGKMTLEDAVQTTIRRTRALARRQLAWFRRDPRIRWFGAGPEGAKGVVDEIEEYLRVGPGAGVHPGPETSSGR